MDDLVALTPCAGLLPATVGGLSLTELRLGSLTLMAAYRNSERALSQTLRSAHGLSWPAPNSSVASGDARAVWFGRGQAMLIGPAPHEALEKHAALSDQSDAWAAVRLGGERSADVLARLVPVDLRPPVFGPGATVRSSLGHMAASISGEEGGGFTILVFRSMAGTLVHELKSAMAAVDARG